MAPPPSATLNRSAFEKTQLKAAQDFSELADISEHNIMSIMSPFLSEVDQQHLQKKN